MRAFLTVDCWFMSMFSLDLGLLFVYFCHFLPLLFGLAVLDLGSSVVSSVHRQQIGSEQRLQNGYFVW